MLLPLVGLCLVPDAALPEDSTWAALGTGSWNTAGNWSPDIVPTGTATFGTSSGTNVTFSSLTTLVDTLQFTNGAPAYHFNLGARTLTITGTGIVNLSSNTPAFAVQSLVKTTGLFFQGGSTAGNASITLAGGSVQFVNTSSAADSTVVNNGGLTLFSNTSSAANSSITNNSGGVAPLSGSRTADAAATNKDAVTNAGLTQFNGASTAGGSTITNNSGSTSFFATSTAANSTITNNKNGSTFFFDASTGGRARFITNSGGIFDISNLTSGGMTAGSIEGAGGYFLGSKTLIVGLTNFSTEVSGIIADGGTKGGSGGLLSKVGTGTLTLTGLNTYSGGTNLSGGTVAVDNDTNLGSGGLSFQGGTLEALVAGGGITSSKAVALNEGGGTFLADGGTTSTLSGAAIGVGALIKDGPGRLILTGANTYSGGTVLKAGILTVHGANALGLGNVVVNGGILNADPQTINVKGHYTQTAGGTLQSQVAGASPGQYDSLNVGGNATLGGILQLISLGFQPKAGDQLTLVRAGGSVSGRFAQFEDPFATGQGFNIVLLLYGRNSVILEFLNQAVAAPVSLVSTSLQEISPGGGHNNYDSNRANLGGLATGDTEGAEWSAFVSGGYDFHFGHLTVGPVASLQYSYVNIDDFSEKGSLLPLEIHSGSAESLRRDAGLKAFCQWQIGKILIEPSLRAAWEHEYKYSALPIIAGFAGIPGPSTTFFGPSEGHDSAVVSTGLSVQWTPSLTTYLNYDSQLGRDNYDSNAVTGGISVRF